MTVKIEANRISERDKMQVNTYRELEQEYFCKTTASITLVRFRRQSPMLNHGHP
jgi:hypothetical protein